ncbi:nucleotidyltransferase [Candidatus Roizmanbacteria bacterium CG22_combo_CG10-13_8_21_14_all_38_20]|uniref:Nucleotidyltransferase n=1 Tax=Candidatus Roizmanbacteria bacterium CG22_combo_CG10-13_8_21_14_all_38_20 TaxID=1974862 RepID=A0A2H0BUY8_9BACT|nr:DUF86 domain-containing protein [Candidatus Microgenomates bacterium]PIP61485.1 MAG: nucleotidyltransferase [Candidatus Roizmanbacteria bacterium CG22_combo_CG10-13_8_21_14_all_38_20]PJC30711.1 MAG: nucleotidyltransferase [Candidatus Roizmanbacteria bacterium CG_4_9_14_0_2_um_filter_38_17]
MDKKILSDIKKALEKLDDALKQEDSEYIRDSAIKRFELCFDLGWKLMKLYAKTEGLECNSPRSCIRTMFELGILRYDENWMQMITDRNELVHIYRQELADIVYHRLPEYLQMLKAVLDKITKTPTYKDGP